MLRLSKKADYALIAMRHLATREAGAAVSAREIAETYAVPLELLAKVLQRLVRQRLLASVQGTRGGYKLNRPAAQITVADVIQAIDGPLNVTACSPNNHSCEQFDNCGIRDPLWKIKERIVEALATVTVAEMAADAETPAPAAGVAVPVTVLGRTGGRFGEGQPAE
jgi:Rrf2 family protein